MPLVLGLVLPFYTDAGVIAINDHLFKIVDSRAVDDDEDIPIGDAVAILRFMFQVLDLGAGDAVVRGSAVQALIEDNFPQLHSFLTSPDFGVPSPRDSRLDYGRFCQNFRQLTVSILNLNQETQSLSSHSGIPNGVPKVLPEGSRL